ncbi:DUF1552 domain-containing protein [Stenotrophomonas indicatrix]|uniref:DUF1552 domain-containing protein n=1 Tax=Stenotrophomonas indicatrix TaxID=2045451 RepID=UPI00300B3912
MEANPNQLFRSLFPDVRGGTTSGAHIFDPAMEELRELKQGLDSVEKEKLNVHLDAVEQVVKELSDGGGGPIVGCEPDAPDLEDSWVGDNSRRAEVLTAHGKVIAAGLACGVTRVATFQVGASSEENSLYMEPDSDGHRLHIPNAHQSAHRTVGKDEAERIMMWRESRRWYTRRVKALLEELERYPDPDFPNDRLLDHTLVVITSELADGLPENQWDMPLQLIGAQKSLGLNVGASGQGRLLNIRDQAENKEADKWQFWKDQVNLSRIWHTIAAAAGVQSGYDAPEAAGGWPVDVVSGLFSGVR